MAPSMTVQSTIRPMSVAERCQLAAMASTAAGSMTVVARDALVLWAGTVFIVFVVWLSVAWPVRLMGGHDIGLQSPFTPWIVGLAVPLCAVYAIVSAARSLKRGLSRRKVLEADLEKGDVVEDAYRFTGAKRFQEPEHGGLLYFLHTDDDRVLVLYDAESQELGARGKDPLSSSFRPLARLVIARAPNSDVIFDEAFSGEPLNAGDPLELAIPPKEWPESGAYCDAAWAALEQRFGCAEGQPPSG